jgi:hypothetical protein
VGQDENGSESDMEAWNRGFFINDELVGCQFYHCCLFSSFGVFLILRPWVVLSPLVVTTISLLSTGNLCRVLSIFFSFFLCPLI